MEKRVFTNLTKTKDEINKVIVDNLFSLWGYP